jgi:DNA (cytosine-5)-methyltransferase 1
MNDERPTHLDLFSGIGGFALAAQWAGFRTVAFCEVEPFCCAVLRKHWPGVPNLGDVGDVRLPADLVTAGFPCPPFSVAGKRRGTDDDRYLWPETLAALEASGASFFVGENVTGIVNMALDDILVDLEKIGYAAQPFIIPAAGVDAAFVGDRVWIVATSSGARLSTGREVSERTIPIQSVPSGSSMHRRVSLPAERQYEWEEPRLVERPMARATHGLSARLVRLANRGAIQALGNSIVPQVAFEILREIRKLL